MVHQRNKLSIVVVTPQKSIGCASSAIDTYTHQLDTNGHRVTTFFLDTTPFPSITTYLDTHRTDVVLTNSIYYGSGNKYTEAVEFLQYCHNKGVRVVDIAHFGKFDETVDRLLSKRLFVSKTLLLKYTLQAQKKGLDLNKYDYLYNSISFSSWQSYHIKRSTHFTIGRIGRADRDKWDNAIIDVLPFVLKRIPQCRVIIQSMPREREYVIPASLRTHITILPESDSRDDIIKTILSCDILLQTSAIGESFGCAIAEGMAFGKPIITNSTDFLAPVLFDRDNAQTELVEDGVNGFVENTPDAMARRIIELYENPSLYQTISSANSKKAHMLFDPKKLTQRLEKFLFSNADSPLSLPLSFEDYRKKVKQESWNTLFKLNFDYLVRRFRRKLKHLGLSECC